MLLLAVYFFATATAAVTALTCDCLLRAGDHTQGHTIHCAHCTHSVQTGLSLVGRCCDHAHSTELSLYTAGGGADGERGARCAVVDLPPALCGEPFCWDHALWRHYVSLGEARGSANLASVFLAAVGLRAPPVSD